MRNPRKRSTFRPESPSSDPATNVICSSDQVELWVLGLVGLAILGCLVGPRDLLSWALVGLFGFGP